MPTRKAPSRSTRQPSTRRTDTVPEPPAPASLGLGAQNATVLDTAPVQVPPAAPAKPRQRSKPAAKRTTRKA
jgi:hypothetical protein